ncbi:MAG: HDOD domain-containing protein [Candidatus Schekmanbacteria bacterium]|nr:HDOD domain-containing protein [Candidatus Schekmanbacteria bacterium]
MLRYVSIRRTAIPAIRDRDMDRGGILVIDDSNFLRKKLRFALEQAGFAVSAEATSGSEGIGLFRSLSPDLVMVDILLPDRSGAAIVSDLVRENPGAKVLIMSSQGRRDEVETALANGAIGCIYKPWKPEELLETVRKILAAASRPAAAAAMRAALGGETPRPIAGPRPTEPPTAISQQPPAAAVSPLRQEPPAAPPPPRPAPPSADRAPARPRLRQTAENLALTFQELPSLPSTAARLVSLMNEPEVSMSEVLDVVRRDQAITSKVLRLANSASFGVPRSVATIDRAVILVGLNRLRSIALAASISGVLAPQGKNFVLARKLWEHALVSSLTARGVSERLKCRDLEEAFTAGLLHDIGRSVMMERVGDEYARFLKAAVDEGSDASVAAEQDRFGFDHSEVGGLVLDRWQLPAIIVSAVQHHHEPTDAPTDEWAQLSDILRLVDEITHVAGMGFGEVVQGDGHGRKAGLRLGIGPNGIEELARWAAELPKSDPALFEI